LNKYQWFCKWDLFWIENLSIFYEYQQFFQHRICFSIQPPDYSDPWPRLACSSSFFFIMLFNDRTIQHCLLTIWQWNMIRITRWNEMYWGCDRGVLKKIWKCKLKPGKKRQTKGYCEGSYGSFRLRVYRLNSLKQTYSVNNQK
jgi:hypothetical protein